MPKQVLAEDIERFLATVDGVASARLLTSPSGEIDQVYVTADDSTESRVARRVVVAALATQYGIPLEPWRIQVAHLKRFSPTELPRFSVLRVEETLSAAEAQARVQVAWERAGAQVTGTGQARGPAGALHRLRTLAGATLDAARAVVEPAHRRMAVQQVSLTTSMDRPLVLVGITASGLRGPEAFVGAAFQREGTSEAAVHATLDAVTKWLLHAASEDPDAGARGDRRAHLEAMRHFARSTGTHPTSPAPAAPAPQTSMSGTPAPTIDGSRHAEPRPGGIANPVNPDILENLQEIRPQQKGGAAMAAHHEGSRGGLATARPGRANVEDEFCQPLIEARVPVHVRCRDGYEIPHAVLRDIGTYTLLVESEGATELVYKHAIISIRPIGARA